MRSIGIYPGAFDPVHAGHIAFAREAKRICGLDEVVFLPEPSPRGKQDVTRLSDRLALLRASLADEGLRVATLTSQQFTVHQTLPEIEQLFPDATLTLLAGSDVARTFQYRWPGLETLLMRVSLAIGLRGDDVPAEMHDIMASLE